MIFEDVILVLGSRRGIHEMHVLADREAALEVAKGDVEQQVTDRTEELKATGDRYRALIENTSAVPWELADDTGAIVYVAPQMAALFGFEPEKLLPRRNFLDLLHPEDREQFTNFIRGAARRALNQSEHIDSRIVRDDNQVQHMRSFVAMQRSTRDTQSIYGISLDITQQVKLRLELIQAQKLESMGQLAAGIAHEINTPAQFLGDNIRFLDSSMADILTVIGGLVPLAALGPGSSVPAPDISALLLSIDYEYLRDEVPRAIAQSMEGVEQISRIVGAMKEFSHPALERTPLDLNRAISSTITVASNEWKYVADIVTDFDAALPLVSVMPGAFNQVILNMLVNAAHAVADSVADASTKGTITLSTRELADWVEIRIGDTGCGIPDKIRDRIFDQFFTTKPVGKGTGQGLAIAHDVIVKKHGGSISVESQEGVGTTFVIRLPLHVDVTPMAAAA